MDGLGAGARWRRARLRISVGDKLVVVVAATASVIWIAHVYAHGLGESIERGHRLDWGELSASPHARCRFSRPLPRRRRSWYSVRWVSWTRRRTLARVRHRARRARCSGCSLRACRSAWAGGNCGGGCRQPGARGARRRSEGANRSLLTSRSLLSVVHWEGIWSTACDSAGSQSARSTCAMTRWGRTRTSISLGVAFRRPNSSARSSPT